MEINSEEENNIIAAISKADFIMNSSWGLQREISILKCD